ncbi:MAG: RNA polymerase sigma factor (sigma-70 family) [Bacteroidia bacterium]|jgi:RNA polymerase sigma factor (sigma-70 family)
MNSEQNIVVGIKNGNSETLKSVYSDYFGMVRNLVMKNSGSESDAEDVFQDAMVVLFKKFNHSEFDLSAKFKTYLYSVCRNIWLSELKRRGGKMARLKDYEHHIDLGYDFNSNWKETQEEAYLKVEQAMRYLGEKCQSILLLFYYQKQSMQEIAVALDYADADSVKAQKYKCIRQLKRNLNP